MHASARPQWTPPQSKQPPRGNISMLFGTPRAVKLMPASRFGQFGAVATGSRTPQLTPPRGAGYFVFPPGSSPAAALPQIESPDQREEEAERQRQAALDEAYAARLVRDAALRKARLEVEEVEARKGEIDWVRSGGILRDAQGNRDYAKTEAIREELRLSELERVLVERWASYEARWANLVGKAGRVREKTRDVRFEDVPWPVCPAQGRSMSLADLTVDRVEEFLLAGLKVRGCTVTKKERVRGSLLRWHPDKMTGVLARVVDADLDAVRQGISVVVLCLQQLNSRVEST
ncbi:hypothetical protein B0H17DRAFT_1178272 [Mycena rosella]|uniref:Uncharacterized protein n=1 Tax=Mycena rosella TaxID=1033263 RepID=A0AAD7DQN8_MYCRO|nr:hypothetical protein B0H17DRAFT_1178272 [Mycena rosella]